MGNTSSVLPLRGNPPSPQGEGFWDGRGGGLSAETQLGMRKEVKAYEWVEIQV